VTFVVKDSLISHGLFGPTMRATHPIAITRVKPRADFKTVITEGKMNLANGKSVVIFPQSTRMLRFKPEEFSTLGVKLAKAADVFIVPVALKTDFWGMGKYVKEMGPINRKRRIHMAFDKPMRVTGNGREEHQLIIKYIQRKLEEWDQ